MPFRSYWLIWNISIHAPSRERLTLFSKGLISKHFNPRSLAGATGAANISLWNHRISIHAPSRERPVSAAHDKTAARISIHAPSRERHDKVFGYQERYAISIHAPSRERPAKVLVIVPIIPISIHAPSRERRVGRKTITISCKFQSTLPRGSDGTDG